MYTSACAKQCKKATTIPILKMRRLSSRGIKQQISMESSNWTRSYSYVVFYNFSELDLRILVGFGLEDPALRQKSNGWRVDTCSLSHSTFINFWLPLSVHVIQGEIHYQLQKVEHMSRPMKVRSPGHRVICSRMNVSHEPIQTGMNLKNFIEFWEKGKNGPFFPMGPEPWQNLRLKPPLPSCHHKIRIGQRIKAAHTEIWALRWKKKEKLRNSFDDIVWAWDQTALETRMTLTVFIFLSQQTPSCLEQCGQTFLIVLRITVNYNHLQWKSPTQNLVWS